VAFDGDSMGVADLVEVIERVEGLTVLNSGARSSLKNRAFHLRIRVPPPKNYTPGWADAMAARTARFESIGANVGRAGQRCEPAEPMRTDTRMPNGRVPQ
jgi:hypothetical protein